jgi:hypothetical protein
VPIPTFLALAIGLGPRYAAIEEVGIVSWVCQFWVATLAVGLTLVATVVIMGLCCNVLLAGPSKLTDLTANLDWLSKAFSTYAVGAPIFSDADAFRTADDNRVAGKATADDKKALTDTIQRIVALSENLNARARFKTFASLLPVCALVIVVGLFVLGAALPTMPDAVTKPTRVSIFIPPGTESGFVTATGCSCLHDTTAVAVSGLWNRPMLRLIGKGCTNVEWTPPADLHAVIAPA